jgi:hypothetical protein
MNSMKAMFLSALLLLAVVCGYAHGQAAMKDPASSGATDVAAVGPPVVPPKPYYLVSTGIPIIDSSGQKTRIFLAAKIHIGQIDPDKYRVWLSEKPDENVPFIVDDAVFVNGQRFNGFTSYDSPLSHLAEHATSAYRGVPAVDVTDCVRRDGNVFIQCMDIGGLAFCSSPLYLRVVPVDNGPGAIEDQSDQSGASTPSADKSTPPPDVPVADDSTKP